MAFSLNCSSLDTKVEHDGKKTLLYQMEISDLSRGFCGALFFALPLHYTMEMWDRARVISHLDIIMIIVSFYFINVGYNAFTGFRMKEVRKNIWYDALESLGIGIVASTITMLLINQICLDLSTDIIIKTIALEAVPTGLGASLAKNSLGARENNGGKYLEGTSLDIKKVLGSFLGATMVAFNIGPTLEPVFIASSLSWYHLVGIMLFSLTVSYLMIFTSNFVSHEENRTGVLASKWAETVISYVISLLVSAILLWMFGYLNSDISLQLALPWIVVMGYATTLGSSAGRIIL